MKPEMEWEDEKLESPWRYAALHSWDSMEGIFPGAHYFDGNSFDWSGPIFMWAGPFETRELAEIWVQENCLD